MAIEYIKDHVTEANLRLLEQDKESLNLVNLLSAIIRPIQDVEDSFQDLVFKRSVTTATGLTLDNLGTIVGEKRNYRKDSDYRIAIVSRIIINRSGGTADEIIAAIMLLYNTKSIEVTNLYPACYSIFIDQEVEKLTGIKRIISSITPAGVGDFVVIANSRVNGLFELSECSSSRENFLITNNQQLKVYNEATAYDFMVEVDALQEPQGEVGLSELSLNRYDLLVNESIYLVSEDDDTKLDIITSTLDEDDYSIIFEGGELTEIVNE
jgi:hypothetical protein